MVHEIVVDVEATPPGVMLRIHWAGGQHSELRVKRNETGRHGRSTSLETIEIVKQMAGRHADEQIAATLNRLGLRTGVGSTWTEGRVRSARQYHVPATEAPAIPDSTLTLKEAAQHVGISTTALRRLIDNGAVPARQIVACAPLEIDRTVLVTAPVQAAVSAIRRRVHAPRTFTANPAESLFSER